MKKKQFYEKPLMKVFELKQQHALLAGSNDGEIPNNDPYTPESDPFSY